MFKRILSVNELWIGEKKGLVIDGVPVLILHTESGFYAFKDVCPHAGARLSEEGFVNEHSIICTRHGWEFETCTGLGKNPKTAALCRYPVYVDEAEGIWIDLG